MRRILFVILLISLAHAAFAQEVITARRRVPAAPPPTPGFITFRGSPSTEAIALGTKTSNTCATDAYCSQFPVSVCSGCTKVVFYSYKAASGNTQNVPTVTDSAGDTYTACASEANQSTDDMYGGCAYVLSATAGVTSYTVTWSAAVSYATSSSYVLYNIGSLDVLATNSGSSTTTCSAGSMTTTQANDMLLHYCLGTSTHINVGAFTGGSGFTVDDADRKTAQLFQSKVISSAGSVTPSATIASNDYLSVAIAFKSSTAGTAPSGMYPAHVYTVNTSAGTSGSLSYQVAATTGSLLVGQEAGGSLYATAVSDGTNGSWRECGNPNIQQSPIDHSKITSATYYKSNATGGLLDVTVSTSGTGDIGPFMFADVVGADMDATCGHASPTGDIETAASTYTTMPNYAPGFSAGLVFGDVSNDFNTTTGVTSPCSNGFQSNTYGGEDISGGGVWDDENNGTHICANSDNTQHNVTWSASDATLKVQGFSTDVAAFPASGATVYPHAVGNAANSVSGSSGTTVAITGYVPRKAGNMYAVAACTTAAGTIAVSGSVSGAFTAVDGPTTQNGVRCATFYFKNISGSTENITATFGTATTFRDIMLEECEGCSTTAPLDQHSGINATTSSGFTFTGTSVTTTAANEVAFGITFGFNCNLTNQDFPAPASGTRSTDRWSQEVNDGSGNCMSSTILGATGSYHLTSIDPASGSVAGLTSIFTFK